MTDYLVVSKCSVSGQCEWSVNGQRRSVTDGHYIETDALVRIDNAVPISGVSLV